MQTCSEVISKARVSSSLNRRTQNVENPSPAAESGADTSADAAPVIDVSTPPSHERGFENRTR